METGQKKREQTPNLYSLYGEVCEEDELDLYEIYLKIKKHKKVFFTFLLLPLIFAIFFLLLAPPKFKSKAVYKVELPPVPQMLGSEASQMFSVELPQVDLFAVAEGVENLNPLIRGKEFEKLAKLLSLDPAEAAKLKEFSVDRGRKAEMENLPVTLVASESSVIPRAAKGLINYINDLPAVKNPLRARAEILKTAKVATEQKVEKLKAVVQNLRGQAEALGDPQAKATLIVELSAVERQLAELKAQISLIEKALKLDGGAKLAVPPVKPKSPDFPKPLLILTLALFAGLVLGIFAAVVADRVSSRGENKI